MSQDNGNDNFDVFEANVARLLRRAAGGPTMDPARKRQALAALQEELRQTARKGRRRMAMKLLAGGVAAAAVAAMVLIGVLSDDGPRRPVWTDGKAGQVVKLADGTRLYARDGAKYAVLGDRRIRLDAGQVLLLVAKSKPESAFLVETPQGKAQATGTAFTVAAGAKETFVAVGQGRVELSSPAGSVEVRAGQQAVAAEGQPPQRTAAPRFSHTVNWARQQLAGPQLFAPEKPHATGELVVYDPWGQEVRLEQRRFHIDVVIEDGIARTTVDQTFFNHLNWQTEGTFYFPLPPDASLSRLAMYICDGKESATCNEGGMVEREYGQFVYESIVYTRRDPALLEMMEGNIFKMRVFPLLARREKHILLSYTQTLPELYRTLRYGFPMEQSKDKTGELSISVRVIGAAGQYEALSSTHDIQCRTDGADLIVEHSAKDVPPNQDFLLSLRPVKAEETGPTLTCHKQDGQYYLFARWRPKLTGAAEPRARQWFLLNDVSASRSSVDVKAQAFIVERLLAEADDWDSFALVNLDTRVRTWKEGLTPVRGPDAASAGAFAAVVERRGATNLQAAFQAVAAMIRQTGADNPHIVYLGDGVATDGLTKTGDLVALLPKGATFIGLGVGKKVDARLLQSAADATGGVFAAINPDEDVQWRVFDLVSALNTPRLVDVDVAFTDDKGKAIAVDAYPSTGTLCEGEALTVLACTGASLPGKIVLAGRVGDKPFMAEHDLSGARPNAAYIPRLWAAARINRLLRDDADAYKAEIVALSKSYYVVTPFTSLIVLETDADYEKWKVEKGRKDHWQLYPAAAKIVDRVEPAPQGQGGWWNLPSAPLKGTPGHPQTIEEIVDSVLLPVEVPLYGYYPHQRQRMERYSLHALLAGRLPIAGYGSVPLLPEARPGEEGTTMGPGMDPVGALPDVSWRWSAEASMPALSIRGRGELRLRRLMPMLPVVGDFGGFGAGGRGGRFGGTWGFSGSGLIGVESLLEENKPVSRPMPLGYLSLTSHRTIMPLMLGLDLNGDLYGSVVLDEGLDVGMSMAVKHGGLVQRLGELLPAIRGAEESRKSLASALMPMSAIAGAGRPFGWAGALDELSDRQFGRAQWERWMVDRDRIRQFNRRYSGWYGDDWNTWDSDRREDAAAPVVNLLGRLTVERGLVRGEVRQLVDSDEESVPVLISSGKVMDRPVLGPPSLFLRSYIQATGAVPGALTAMALDRLLPLRQKLQAMKASENRDAALAAIEKLLAKLPEAAAATESTGIFWSHQGWATTPAAWEFQQPQCQAWTGSRAMTDLTRYAPGLGSDWSDVAAVVLEAFGTKPAGKVDDKAAAAIAAARGRIPTQRVRYTDKDGKTLLELWAGADRFAWTGTSAMYLREDFVCDGEHFYQVYPELGLAARRGQLKWRLPAIRALVPHLLPPAEELARAFDVKLEASAGDSSTVRLTPIAPKAEVATQPKGQAEKAPDLAILATFDGRGFLHKLEWRDGDKTLLTCDYSFEKSRVKATWKAGEKTAEGLEYAIEIGQPATDPFARPGEDTVVIDMPLRRPAHYEALLKELGEAAEKAAERTGLRRQLALAHIQDFGWQQPWGAVQPASDAMTAALREQAAAGRKEALRGDLAILSAAGFGQSLAGMNLGLALPANWPLLRYWQAQHDVNQMGRLATEAKGTFAGHMATFAMVPRGGNQGQAAAYRLMAEYPDSPLLYAAASYGGGSEALWLELAKRPQWRFVALCSAAIQHQTAAVGKAFEDYHKELAEKGAEVPISSHLAIALKTEPDRWQRVVERYLAAAMKSKDPGRLLRFAEFAWRNGKAELATLALDTAGDLVAKDLPLTWKLALAQTQWAMGQVKDAWKTQQEVMAAFEKAGPGQTGRPGQKPSPALLALSARLAQAAGDAEAAVDLELRAIEAEKPHMPQRINVYLYRQRYQWLWGQLQQRVERRAQEAKAKPQDTEARRRLEAAMAQAKDIWETWLRADASNNVTLYQQLAGLYWTAGDKEEAWRIVSSLIDEKPKDGSSYYHVGNWMSASGEREVGLKMYAKAYEVEPNNGDWIWGRAELLRQMGRKAEARELFQEIAAKKWQPRFEHYNNKAKEVLKGL